LQIISRNSPKLEADITKWKTGAVAGVATQPI